MCSLPLASSNSIVWSESFSVSLPLTRIQFNSLRVDPHQQSVVDAGGFAVWRRSAAPSEHSRPLHNHLTAVESEGSGCPDAGVDCSPRLVCSAGVVQVCIRNEEDGRASVLSSLPCTRRRRAEICLYLPEWFFQSAGWRPHNLPESAESLTQKVLEPTKKRGKTV